MKMPPEDLAEFAILCRDERKKCEQSLMLYQSHQQSTRPASEGLPEAAYFRQVISNFDALISSIEGGV